MNEITLNSLLSTDTRWRSLCSLLDEEQQWKFVAAFANISTDDNVFQTVDSPSRELLSRWKEVSGVTVFTLIKVLSELELKNALLLIESWIPEHSKQIQELITCKTPSKKLKVEHRVDDTLLTKPQFTANYHYFENLEPGTLPEEEFKYWQAMKLCWNDYATHSLPLIENSTYPPSILRVCMIHKSVEKEGAKFNKYREKCLPLKEWFLKEALTGNPVSQFHMAAYADVIEHDTPMLVFWEQKSADGGYAPAQNRLGWCFEIGEGVTQDWDQAVSWYQKAADQGYVHAECNIAWCHEHGKGFEQDYEKALEGYRKVAAKGYGRGFYSIGLCYQDGYGVPKDLVKAVEWFKQGADIGHGRSQYKMGYYYYHGLGGLPKDGQQALYWFRLSADIGVAHSQAFLGWFYEEGICVNKDENLGFYWYNRAAIQEDASSAWYPTGYCYFYGKGTCKNYKKAFYWLQKAAEDEKAQHLLGLCYHYGWGVEHDAEAALTWLKKAVDSNKGGYQIRRDYTNIQELYNPQKSAKEE